MSEEVFNLDRAQAEEARVDAFGKKWKVIVNKQNGLCHARPEPDRADAVIPDHMEGLWTKPSLLLEQIDAHVRKSWDMAEQAKLKAARKLQAEKEHKALMKRMEEEARAEEEKAEVTAKEGEDEGTSQEASADDTGSVKEDAQPKKKVTKKAKKKAA